MKQTRPREICTCLLREPKNQKPQIFTGLEPCRCYKGCLKGSKESYEFVGVAVLTQAPQASNLPCGTLPSTCHSVAEVVLGFRDVSGLGGLRVSTANIRTSQNKIFASRHSVSGGMRLRGSSRVTRALTPRRPNNPRTRNPQPYRFESTGGLKYNPEPSRRLGFSWLGTRQ